MWVKRIVMLFLLAGIGAGGFVTRDYWQPWFFPERPAEPKSDTEPAGVPADSCLLTDQAIANLGIESRPLKPGAFWRTIQVPGMIVDRPGQSDRTIVAPVTSVVQSIHRVPGETVRPGEPLFTLRLLSESLHQSQTELFRASQDVKLTRAQRTRLAASGNVVPEARLIELDNQIARYETAVRAYRQELTNRGFSSEQIASVVEGRFVNEMTVSAPTANGGRQTPKFFEMQEHKVDLGQQVQAGQALCVLSNHQALAIEGQAFREETPLLERALKSGWPIEIDFQESPGSDWPATITTARIDKLGNTIDPVNRTFAFWLPLQNESRSVERDGRITHLWRFRPGQKVRLKVPIEKLENVFVLPADAVTTDGLESFTFTQNANTFNRRPVRVVARDRQSVVVANDGSIAMGTYAVQSAAAKLNRMLKSQSNSVPKGYHMHADGSLHKNGEPD